MLALARAHHPTESLRGLIPIVKTQLAPDREPFLTGDLSAELIEVKEVTELLPPGGGTAFGITATKSSSSSTLALSIAS